MTDHNSTAGGVGGGHPAGQPASFGASAQPPGTGPQPQGQGAPAPGNRQHPGFQPLSPDAARAQVAAAWVRRAPQAAVPPAEAAVPPLPPRDTRGGDGGKKEKRERAKAERRAEQERKRAARQARKAGGSAPAPHPASLSHPASAAQPVPVPVPQSAAAPHTAPPASARAAAAPASAQAPASVPSPAPAGGSTATGRRNGFDVPPPGGRVPAAGRRTHVALRATVLITVCVLALGLCGVLGLLIGKSGTRTAELSAADVKRYKLSEFPTDAAATFAERYAMLCMTFSPEDSDAREAALAQYISAGVDPRCGWTGKGTAEAVSATWDGTAEPLPEFGKNGRYLGVHVRQSSGRVMAVTVPVYVKDLRAAQGFRVVGDVGVMPLPSGGRAPEITEEIVVDEQLSAQLESDVLPGFFAAWGASDDTAMARFTTRDASVSATSGLRGALEEPSIESVEAVAPAGTASGDTPDYREDQEVTARVSVEWTDADGAEVLRAYRVTVVNTEQGWFIKDIGGGVPDPEGGESGLADEAPESGDTAGSGEDASSGGQDDADGSSDEEDTADDPSGDEDTGAKKPRDKDGKRS